MNITTIKNYLLPLLAGMALPFAYAPFNQFWIALVVPALLWYLLQDTTSKQAWWKGALFGLGYFGIGVSWVYISIHVYGQTPIIMAALITLGFVLVLSVFTAGFCYSFVKLIPKASVNLKNIIIFASLWVLWEWLRGWFLTGFPWLFIGYSQIDTSLANFAPLTGIYGVSWLTVFFSGLLLYLFKLWRENQQRQKITVITILILLPLIGWLLSFAAWTNPKGDLTNVTIVQPNTPQDIKWVGEHGAQIVADIVELSFAALSQRHHLIIWPEAALPYTINQVKPTLDILSLGAYAVDNTLITGILNQADSRHFYNSIIAIGKGDGIYYKQHLVPFGEYIPFEAQLGKLLQVLALPLPATVPGPANQPGLHAGSLSIAPAICFEIVYPSLVLDNFKAANADLLLTISNDTWFGTSIGPHQHLQMARMRALELGRYLIRATNNGITAIINDKGQVTDQLPQFEATTLTSTVQAMQGKTPLVFYGHGGVIFVIAAALGWCVFRRYRR